MNKQIISAALALTLCALSLSACAGDGGFSQRETLSSGYTRSTDTEKTYNFPDGANEPPTAYNSYANLVTNFELKLFRSLFREQESDSFTLSPACAALTLSQLASGAKGDTRGEITLALGSGLTADSLNQCSSYFQSRLHSVKSTDKDDEKSVSLGRSLLINDTTDVRTAFLQTNADYYNSAIYRFDFDSGNSKQKLLQSLGNSDFDCAGSMIAANSAKIHDSWITPSEPITDGGKTYLCSDESYLHTDRAQGVVKYTANTPVKMLLIMPNEGLSLREYVNTFDASEYSDLLQSFSVTEYRNAQVPGFSCQSGVQKLNAALETCGLYRLFDEKADFSGIAHSAISLDAVYELPFCLSYTAGGIAAGSAASPDAASKLFGGTYKTEQKPLRFDRPFLWMIIDNESNIPLIMGTAN